MTKQQDYQPQASACFNEVAKKILNNSSELPFWHVGRTFNTCHDYIRQNGANVPNDVKLYRDSVRPACERFYVKNAGARDNQTWWWDDYGWWGLAHLATGDLEKAKDCWLRMRTYGVDEGPE